MSFLKQLREVTRKRGIEWMGEGADDVLFDCVEFMEEAGEVAGAIKKMHRASKGWAGTTKNLEDLADEVGDVMITLESLVARYGIDIEAATRNKFNKTSVKYGLKTMFPPAENDLDTPEEVEANTTVEDRLKEIRLRCRRKALMRYGYHNEEDLSYWGDSTDGINVDKYEQDLFSVVKDGLFD